MMKKAAVALFFLGMTATIAQAIDMQDLESPIGDRETPRL
jgi:hypothetical protein